MSEYVAELAHFQTCAVVQEVRGSCSVGEADNTNLTARKSNLHPAFYDLSNYNQYLVKSDEMVALPDYSDYKAFFPASEITYTFRMDGKEVKLSNDVFPKVSLQSSRVEALAFPENTDVGSFLHDVEVRISGFESLAGSNNEALKRIAVRYLYEYSRRVYAGTDKPFYQGKQFNATLPINSKGKQGHFGFEFSDDNSQAVVRYFGDASLEAQLVKKGLTTGRIISRLKQDFGIGEVINGTSRWTKSELNKVYTAFTLLPRQDLKVLQGLILEKVAKISNDIEDIHTLAHFSSKVDTRSAQVLTRKIVVSNKAFEADFATGEFAATFALNRKNQVIPVSLVTVLHEVGHGVEKLTLLKRSLDEGLAIKAHNAYLDKYNQQVQQYNQALAKKNSALNAWQQQKDVALKTLLNQADAVEAEKAQATYARVFEQIKALNSIVLQLVNAHSAEKVNLKKVVKALEATKLRNVITAGNNIISFKRRAWQRPITADYNEQNGLLWGKFQQASRDELNRVEQHFLKRQEERNGIIDTHNRLVKLSDELIQWLNSGDFDAIDAHTRKRLASEFSEFRLKKAVDALFAAGEKVELERRELEGAEKDVNRVKQPMAESKFVAEAGGRSGNDGEPNDSYRLQNFVKFVKKQGLQPSEKSPLTDYSLRSWQEKKYGEYFAEAYSLYLTQHQFLLQHKPELYHYFDARAYRIDRLISVSVKNQSLLIKEL